jgi:hypothetical protein
MSITRRVVSLLAAMAVAAALAIGSVAPASAQAPAAGALRDALVGTWVGTYEGYHDGVLESGQQRFVITNVRGAHVKGTWQYRKDAKANWTAKKPMQWVVLRDAQDGDWNITGADANGIYIGSFTPGDTRLVISYQGSTNDLVTYRFDVRRR